MSLSDRQKSEITSFLKSKIRQKLKQYDKRETPAMPFHFRLLGKDRMAVYSFVASINTSLGGAIFEGIAKLIASERYVEAQSQFGGFNNTISTEAQIVIQDIIDDLTTGRSVPNKIAETKRIIAVAQNGAFKQQKPAKIDLYLKSKEGIEYYFDLKTVKPNKGDFQKFKRSLLEWIAIRAAKDSKVDIRTLLALPYNPNEPEPYDRWTMKGIFDVQNELMVGVEFWDFIGGAGTYEDLLKIFEDVGISLKPELDEAFKKFGNN